MLEIATDNRNRTASEIRHYFSKSNGNLGEAGCVAWMFNRVGLISIARENITMDEEEFMLKALELGAEDVRDEEEQYDVITSVDTFLDIKEALEEDGFTIDEADIVMLPENTVEIDDVDMAARIIKLIDLLEDHDDVQNVYTNMSVTDEVMEKLD